MAARRLRAKAALYAIRRELAPLAVGLVAEGGGATVWAVNSAPEALRATLAVSACTLAGTAEELDRREVVVPALGVVELGRFDDAGLGERVLAA